MTSTGPLASRQGTQAIFEEDPRCLYISLHRYGQRWYPETGALDEMGEGKGSGTTINVPWPENGMADSDYLAAMRLVVVPALSDFAPDLLLISAGFDAADGDAQGSMRVSPRGFAAMAEMMLTAVSCPVAAALVHMPARLEPVPWQAPQSHPTPEAEASGRVPSRPCFLTPCLAVPACCVAAGGRLQHAGDVRVL